MRASYQGARYDSTFGDGANRKNTRPASGAAKKLFQKRPSALHSAAGSLARRENAGAYARWARLPTALSPVLKQLLSGVCRFRSPLNSQSGIRNLQ
jgi:hypothetical protein